MKHKGTIRLETPRLFLRPFQKSDIPLAYRNWMSDPAVTKFLRWPTHSSSSVTEEVVGSWIEAYKDPDFYQWVIVLKETNEPIGSISVVEMNEKTDTVHIGYCIGSRWWHMGYTSEAYSAIIPFLFDEVKANRIESQHDPNNPHSGNVMKKCGLTYEGTLRKADWSNQGIVDAARYALLAEDYYKTVR